MIAEVKFYIISLVFVFILLLSSATQSFADVIAATAVGTHNETEISKGQCPPGYVYDPEAIGIAKCAKCSDGYVLDLSQKWNKCFQCPPGYQYQSGKCYK